MKYFQRQSLLNRKAAVPDLNSTRHYFECLMNINVLKSSPFGICYWANNVAYISLLTLVTDVSVKKYTAMPKDITI